MDSSISLLVRGYLRIGDLTTIHKIEILRYLIEEVGAYLRYVPDFLPVDRWMHPDILRLQRDFEEGAVDLGSNITKRTKIIPISDIIFSQNSDEDGGEEVEKATLFLSSNGKFFLLREHYREIKETRDEDVWTIQQVSLFSLELSNSFEELVALEDQVMRSQRASILIPIRTLLRTINAEGERKAKRGQAMAESAKMANAVAGIFVFD